MAAPSSTRLRDALTDYLAACAACLSEPPGHQLVSVGPPVVKCALLAVYAQVPTTVTIPQPGAIPAPVKQPRVRVVPLVAELWRSVCTDDDIEQRHADGLAHATAGWELFAGLTYRLSQGQVFTTLDTPASTQAANVDFGELIEPQGGFAGWRVTTSVQL